MRALRAAVPALVSCLLIACGSDSDIPNPSPPTGASGVAGASGASAATGGTGSTSVGGTSSAGAPGGRAGASSGGGAGASGSAGLAGKGGASNGGAGADSGAGGAGASAAGASSTGGASGVAGASGAAGVTSGSGGSGGTTLAVSTTWQDAVGTWTLDRITEKLTIRIQGQSATTLVATSDGGETVTKVSSDGTALTFCVTTSEGGEWYHGTIVLGTFRGRVAAASACDVAPTDPTLYAAHVTGWTSRVFDAEKTKRVFDVIGPAGERIKLRLDVDASGNLLGRAKRYATIVSGAAGEALEYDLLVTSWDGAHVELQGNVFGYVGNVGQICSLDVAETEISGTCLETNTLEPKSLSGHRVEILTYGLTPRTTDERAAWQDRARKQVAHMSMGENPAPTSTTATVLASNHQPLLSITPLPGRDDNPKGWPQPYVFDELAFTWTLPDPLGGPDLSRAGHGFVFRPSGEPPKGGWPIAITLNGHAGSAKEMTNPDDYEYWFGESFARRGYVVVTVDVGHRSLEDRAALYSEYVTGDRPQDGNYPHPAVKSPGMDSDWEEYGERTWDVLRAIDYALTVPGVNPEKVVVTGHSMGGIDTVFTAAFDPRVKVAVPSGFAGDFDVYLYSIVHACWRWQNADIRDYLGVADYHAMVAPRPLIMMNGKADHVNTAFNPPWVDTKQVYRRAAAAWADAPGALTMYLHYDIHLYHVGDVDPVMAEPIGVQVPLILSNTGGVFDTAWQTDGAVASDGRTLFDRIDALWQLMPRRQVGAWGCYAQSPDPFGARGALAAPSRLPCLS